jgi:hypothetical protein
MRLFRQWKVANMPKSGSVDVRFFDHFIKSHRADSYLFLSQNEYIVHAYSCLASFFVCDISFRIVCFFKVSISTMFE